MKGKKEDRGRFSVFMRYFMNSLKQLVNEAITKVIDGETDFLKILQNQYRMCQGIRIEKSDVGCFVDFQFDINAEKVSPPNAYIGDTFLKLKQIKSDIGLILFIENGTMSMLEFYICGDDVFPDVFDDYEFVYENGNRNYETYIKQRGNT